LQRWLCDNDSSTDKAVGIIIIIFSFFNNSLTEDCLSSLKGKQISGYLGALVASMDIGQTQPEKITVHSLS